MKMQIADYEVRPGVVPSGEKAVVRIIPRGKHARFDDQVHRQPKGSPFQFAPEVFEPDADIEYKIYFLPMEQSTAPEPMSVCESVLVRPCADGSLEFQHVFQGSRNISLSSWIPMTGSCCACPFTLSIRICTADGPIGAICMSIPIFRMGGRIL